MKTVLHLGADRKKVNFGWLNSYHSFSFGNYYDAAKTNFGALRVLNDDNIKGGTGFGKHPHDNMEIISIPLQGALQHEDTTGTKAIIKENDVQIMSAGTGLQHAEKNNSQTEETSFLQIWIFPKKENIAPRYDQKSFAPALRKNQLQVVVSPTDSNAVWINQDAWLSRYDPDAGSQLTYNLNQKGNGVYVFVLEGSITINDQTLQTRDALGIWDADSINLSANTSSQVLFIDVPMNI